MSQDVVIGLVIGLLILTFGAWLVLADRDRRRNMTSAEREAEDALHDSDQRW